ncbi:hypothetical protein ES707_14963 [subsurface metagenome]
MYLYEAIQTVLNQRRNVPMTIEEIATAINKQQLYCKKDGSDVTPWQVALRAASDITKSTQPMFEVLIKSKTRV